MANPNEQLASIPFGTLIGDPLKATVEAQAIAARSTVDFINDVGFKTITNNKETTKEVRYVSFTYKKRDTTGTEQTFQVDVPVLTIVPIPFIRINEFNLNFKAKITSIETEQTKKSNSLAMDASISASAKYLFFKANMNASVSSKKDSSSTKDSRYSTEYTMDINVHAQQDDIPAGLSRMLNILEDQVTHQLKPSNGVDKAKSVEAKNP
ncbi:DUF2589 domain-containing protein [Xanthovirga aplysinae]|uniref:DUF2589 domain-containing protein n=1 Tax=Xanthovirga aplysinae TaxID=2529853 RepID=UPI0012BBE5C8|nr:DUF2589 domain-containing protein [Xanthovirga aplysinae]MTI32111.1 DUF2589 domain-containing protein [Xanthovirga aplysinae]